MNNKILLILALTLSTQFCFAQGGVWTWVHGVQTTNYAGNYGTKGVSAPTNEPPSRYEGTYWTDLNGEFWMFGGANTGGTYMNDLWKYNPQNNEWTWMHGPMLNGNPAGTYGTKGISSPLNLPPGRGLGALCWTGTDGNLYLFGGRGFQFPSSFDDLWRYNIATNEWTWISGGNNNALAVSPTYGTKGVASINNHPGDREETKSCWTTNDKLWFFAGLTFNDMWMYDLTTDMWTWVAGSNTQFPPSNYGTKGVASPNNEPQFGMSFTNWQQNDKFYLFGGANYQNFLWEFDTQTLLWTWIGGTQNASDLGTVNATNCTESQNYIPAGRVENQTIQSSKTVQAGCYTPLWSFGGMELGSGVNLFNDLWMYNSVADTWTLVSGQNSPSLSTGNFGTRGVAAASNEISSRGGVHFWEDKNRNLYVFGGWKGGATLGDLWKFTPDTSCIKLPTTNSPITWPNDFTICQNDTVTIQFPSDVLIDVSPTGFSNYNSNTGTLYLYPTTTQNFQITAKPPTGLPCPFQEETKNINVDVLYPPTALFALQPTNTTLKSPTFSSVNNSTNADTYSWSYQNKVFSTDKNFTKTFDAKGTYCFTLVAQNNCGSDTANQCGAIDGEIFIPNAFSPNNDGNNDVIKLVFSGSVDLIEFSIFNRWGQKVFETNNPDQAWDGKTKGVESEIGTYFYIVKYKNLSEKTDVLRGDITLIR